MRELLAEIQLARSYSFALSDRWFLSLAYL
jgi:hypothetical protein